jgi:pyruvate dehydrogenase E2 component (dihydrolipoamide acetyltransferase)
MSVAEMVEIPLPRLSDSMEEGTIVQWLATAGDTVNAGDAIVEIETDKATMEYEAEHGGVLEILVPAGSTVALGTAIARLLPEGSQASQPSEGSEASQAPPAATPAAAPAPAAPPPARSERTLATPVARRMAAEHGLDLREIAATGRRGQIVKADVEAHARNGSAPAPATAAPAPATAAPAPATAAPGEVRREELTRVQRTIARRMAESRAQVPDFEVSVDIEMSASLDLRAQLAAHLDPVPSLNDMIVRACALALREQPRVNGAYRDEGFDLHDDVNVGIAVAGQDALMVAVVAHADRTPLSEIAVATRRLAARARSGEITPPELSGATFTVSNLGMFGVDRFTAIINQPQAAILAVGAVADRPVVRDGAVVAGKVMTASLACDHRILYGADAARFVTDVRDRLQAPLGLLV